MQEKMAEKASLMNVEELLADFNWKTSGNAAALEKRLLGELHALEAVSSFFLLYNFWITRGKVKREERRKISFIHA